MIRKVLALLMVILFGAFNANAQSSCDKLYATAVKYQQRMTVASQNQAISYFKKPKFVMILLQKRNYAKVKLQLVTIQLL